ncbi:hypothetical protein PVAND_006431 [Polypedilum vanderplanki]|uniref:Uncharacterized protein n=1 Tax=Polypedilum vanderplanki TaxID=319348 RepID=A0A9J6C3M0_POLVA|nr:hypothetical protein PVAND_006431 [Polypedilum vanderplanki]
MHTYQVGIVPIEELTSEQSADATAAVDPVDSQFSEETQEQNEVIHEEQHYPLTPSLMPSTSSIVAEELTSHASLRKRPKHGSVVFKAESPTQVSPGVRVSTPHPRLLKDNPLTPRRSLRLQSIQKTPRRSTRIQQLQAMTASKRTPTPRKRAPSKQATTSSSVKRKATMPLTPVSSSKKSRRNTYN